MFGQNYVFNWVTISDFLRITYRLIIYLAHLRKYSVFDWFKK